VSTSRLTAIHCHQARRGWKAGKAGKCPALEIYTPGWVLSIVRRSGTLGSDEIVIGQRNVSAGILLSELPSFPGIQPHFMHIVVNCKKSLDEPRVLRHNSATGRV
jgi:hypothetical protein